MADSICMVCKIPTLRTHHDVGNDHDLCDDCKATIIDDFKRIWPQLCPESKAVNAYRMRLDNYKE